MQAKKPANQRTGSRGASAGGGGPAAQAGMGFQNRAAAWVAAHILAEQAASPPWDLSAATTLDFVRCETEQPVDDLLVGTSEGGFVFVQAKHSLRLEVGADSALASAVDQFVRQFVVSQSATPGRPWERPLSPDRDRLVLLIGPHSSAPIRENLPSALRAKSQALASGYPTQAIVLNKEEDRALRVFQGHMARSWQRLTGSELSDDYLHQLLPLIRIHTLDIDAGGSAEREAKGLLRSAVLHDALSADVAWNTLVQACADFASSREGASRERLQKVLLDAGIHLRAPRSYDADIRRLREYSHSTVALLSDLARIRVGSAEVKITRRSTQALRSAAEQNSIVVVGDPGAGKSGALHDLVLMLHDEDRDVVFLAVDRLQAQSLNALRDEIGLSHDLLTVLANWHGPQPAFLVIDALDAARSDRSLQAFRDLMSQTTKRDSRWRVVASIRRFDLRHSQKIHQLFLGTPAAEFQDAEFASVSHISIPKLQDEELDQVRAQSHELAHLLTVAESSLRDLLRVPFNLRLMGELVGEGVAVAELTPIHTQIELLERYWSHLVIRDDRQGDARENVLRRVVSPMVEARTLRVERAHVATDASTSVILHDLLSSNILSEWQPLPTAAPESYVLTFAHHVLFDYVVARLLLRGDPGTLVERLASEPELVLAIRPSLVLHFQYIWFADTTRSLFWHLVLLVLQAEQVPTVGKLIGPGVAAELATRIEEFAPLFAALESGETAVRDAADHALRHVVGALLAVPSDQTQSLVGEGAGPWCELLERVSRRIRPPVAYTVRVLLSAICEHPEAFTAEQRSNAGTASRRLFEFAWSQTSRDRWLVTDALKAVCRTFESDPSTSAALVRRCLDPAHLTEYGYEELPWLAREVGRLIPLDPGLVEDIYRAAFTYRDPSEAQTSMGGRIVGMTSTRRQDYGSALYGLAKAYPCFLSVAPVHATRALITAIDFYITQRHSPPSGEIIEETFSFWEREARIRADYGYIWDSGDTYRHDEPLKMLDDFESFLRQLAQDAERVGQFRQIIDVLTTHNRLATLWRRLLTVGAEFPDTLGREVRALAWSPPILSFHDTTIAAGKFLAAVFGFLNGKDRERIERAILAIPDSARTRSPESREWTRNRLLGCVAPEHLVTDDARRLLRELATAGDIPPNVPLFGPIEATWEERPYGEKEYLTDEGVPVEADANRRIQALEQPVREFVERHQHSSPTAQDIEGVLPALRSLRGALSTADVDGVHPKQRDYAWGRLADACERIAVYESLPCEDEAGAFAKAVLLEAAQHPDPVHQPEYDAQFDELPSWASPAPRIQAAAGLTWLVRQPTCVDQTVLGTIERLSKDPVPAVRFQVATRLIALYRTAPKLMWTVLEWLCLEETSRGVLQGLLNDPLRRLAGSHANRIADLTEAIYERVTSGPGAKSVRDACTSIFLRLYLWQDNPLCRNMVFGIVGAPSDCADEAQRIILNLRDLLTHGPVSPPDPTQDEVRQRALGLMANMLKSAHEGLNKLESEHKDMPFESWSPDEQERARTLARLVDSIGTEIYFASGAFEDEKQERGDPARVLSIEKKQRFLEETAPLLDELAELGFPSLVHNLLKTLESFVSLDPTGVFLRIGRIVRAGQRGGYQYESPAVDLVVRLIQRYLAEHQAVFRDKKCQRTLLEVLDTFVEAGWPSARRLAYRLEEIFR